MERRPATRWGRSSDRYFAADLSSVPPALQAVVAEAVAHVDARMQTTCGLAAYGSLRGRGSQSEVALSSWPDPRHWSAANESRSALCGCSVAVESSEPKQRLLLVAVCCERLLPGHFTPIVLSGSRIGLDAYFRWLLEKALIRFHASVAARLPLSPKFTARR